MSSQDVRDGLNFKLSFGRRRVLKSSATERTNPRDLDTSNSLIWKALRLRLIKMELYVFLRSSPITSTASDDIVPVILKSSNSCECR